MKIVITGAGGRLGAALVREYKGRSEVTGFTHAQLDLGKADQVRASLEPLGFELLINAAAFTNVDLAEKEKDQAFRINADAPRLLAQICREKGAKLIHVSTDYVFDGEKRESYFEDDEPRPISAYGESKVAGENAVLEVDANHLVVRVSWVFGPDRPSFVDQMIARAREHDTIAAVADKWSTPTYTKDIADMLMRVLAGDVVAGVGDPGREKAQQTQPAGVTDPGYKASGILHVANAGQCTWQEYAQHALNCCHELGLPLKATQVGAVKMSDMTSWIARRPVHSVLGTPKYEKIAGTAPRPWQEAVADYVRDYVAR